MKQRVVKTVAEWEEVVEELLVTLEPAAGATVLALSGDLGVGKTTFVQRLAKKLGVTEPVTSPTFTLMKRYETTDETFPNLIHMDAYRLDSAEELGPLRFDELLNTPKTLICIEWAERIESVLPKQTHFFILTIDKEGQHTIQRVS